VTEENHETELRLSCLLWGLRIGNFISAPTRSIIGEDYDERISLNADLGSKVSIRRQHFRGARGRVDG
jgi:hypothetical protein